MKTLSPALAAHLAGGVTTLAYCWQLTRRDGLVLGFTEHDADVVYNGVTFRAATGFTASQIQQSLGLAVDNLEAQGALSSLSITEADLLAGRYDDAVVQLFWVNWADPSMGIAIAKGNLGQVKRQGLAFSAELRSLSHRMNQKIGFTYGRTCSARLGDSRCTVNVATSAGQNFEIKTHARTGGVDRVELWEAPEVPFAAGDAATFSAGCKKDIGTCFNKFNNIVNFRGFPHIPGMDAVTRYPVPGTTDLNGGSLFNGVS